MAFGRFVLLFLAVSLVFAGFNQASYAQSADSKAYSVIEITKVILTFTDEQISEGNTADAEEYSKIVSDQFANNLPPLKELDSDTTDEIHLLLLDLPSTIKSNPHGASSIIGQILNLLDTYSVSDYAPEFMISNMMIIADEEYQKYIDKNKESSYKLAKTLFAESEQRFLQETSFDTRLHEELVSFYKELLGLVENKANFVTVGAMTSAIQRDLVGTENVFFDEKSLYDKIYTLYDQLLVKLDEGDYAAAEELAIEAYLENFEYLEPNIERVDSELLNALEWDMREELRNMIKNKQDASRITIFLTESIIPDLNTAEEKVMAHLQNNPNPNAAFAESRVLKAMGDASDDAKSSVKNEIDFIRDSLQEMMIHYQNEDYQSAYATARTAYLDSYEYVEIPLRPIDPDFTLEVEYLFAELRNQIKEQAPYEEVQKTAIEIKRNLDESERLVTGTGTLAPMIAFSASFALIFREGLESVLILGAIITYLEASRNIKFKKYIYYGIVAAIGATGATWIVANYIISISGASRELIEAIAALSATAVLFYVSFWILNKIEHKKWMEFVKAKVWQATTTGSVMVFVMLSFFTVYREGFESVLFYQAMFGFAKYMEAYVLLGFVLGMASLLGLYFFMRKIGKRLPLRVLFGLTMGIGAYLSIAFLGNAIRELQILDIVPYTGMIGIIPRLDITLAHMTGIYPTLETLIGQIVLLGIYVAAVSYILVINPRKEKKIAKMRKSWKKENVEQTS